MNIFHFRKESICRLKTPATINYYQDIKEKGLSLYITPKGIITFFIRKKVEGKNVRIKIGRFPECSVQQARCMAIKIKAQIANGKNPVKQKQKIVIEKQKIDNALTFEKMFENYMDRHSKKEKKTWQSDEADINRLAKHLFSKNASTITKNELVKLHQKIGEENGKFQANRFLDRLRAIFSKAIEWGWKYENPALDIVKFKEKSRDRFLQKTEIASLLKALKKESNTIIRDYILISLLTGVRKSNVCSMQWSHVDHDSKIWIIPETKNGQPVVVPIVDKVIEILNFRKLDNIKLGFVESKYVFPGKGKTGHLVEPKKTWNNILKEAGLKDLRLHDLRRTFGSWQAINGSSIQVIGKSLGHKSSSATAVYARLSIDPVRESVEKVTQFMLDD